MTREVEWEKELVRCIADEVRRYRNKRRMSAQQLADRCRDLGYDIPRSVLANLESYRRKSVSLAELLVLAEALEVPPVLLISRFGQVDSVEILPDRNVHPWHVVEWISGDEPLPGSEPETRSSFGLIGAYKLFLEHLESFNRAVGRWQHTKKRTIKRRKEETVEQHVRDLANTEREVYLRQDAVHNAEWFLNSRALQAGAIPSALTSYLPDSVDRYDILEEQAPNSVYRYQDPEEPE
ncbi:helix-turn-helix domain-containing protein [Pseudonocardia lutea]|uniref:Helix-turn-helix domain-containing protein n=1 Tax=Pseudonocardia lutea TaxID=2172015 RepID=A0ABW1IEN3_9PSEU